MYKKENHGFFKSLKKQVKQIKTEKDSQVKIQDNFPEFNRTEIADNKMPSNSAGKLHQDNQLLRYILVMWFNLKNVKYSGIQAEKCTRGKKKIG